MNTDTHDGISTLMERVRECAARGSVLVLEGDTDVSFFNGLLGDQCPATISAEGRINALAIAANVPTDTLLDSMVLTIVDSDFDRITMKGELFRFKDAIHVIFTDAHDLETTIISVEEVRRRVLTTVLRCTYLQSIDVWTRALAYQIEVSLVRLLIHQEDWGVSVEGVPPHAINDVAGRPNRGRLVSELFPRFESRSIDIEQGELMARLSELEDFRTDWPQLINGHELCKSIAVYSRQLIGRTVSYTEIESALRVSFQLKHLAAADMARQIRRWWEAKGISPFFDMVSP
jgi:hypothetical protein